MEKVDDTLKFSRCGCLLTNHSTFLLGIHFVTLLKMLNKMTKKSIYAVWRKRIFFFHHPKKHFSLEIINKARLKFDLALYSTQEGDVYYDMPSPNLVANKKNFSTWKMLQSIITFCWNKKELVFMSNSLLTFYNHFLKWYEWKKLMSCFAMLEILILTFFNDVTHYSTGRFIAKEHGSNLRVSGYFWLRNHETRPDPQNICKHRVLLISTRGCVKWTQWGLASVVFMRRWTFGQHDKTHLNLDCWKNIFCWFNSYWIAECQRKFNVFFFRKVSVIHFDCNFVPLDMIFFYYCAEQISARNSNNFFLSGKRNSLEKIREEMKKKINIWE